MVETVLESVFNFVNEGEGVVLENITTSEPTFTPISSRSGDLVFTTIQVVVTYTHRVEKVPDESPGQTADVCGVREAVDGGPADEH